MFLNETFRFLFVKALKIETQFYRPETANANCQLQTDMGVT